MHNIEYYDYPEKVNRTKVQQELDAHAAFEDRGEGCTGLGQKIRWLDSLSICDDREEAESCIRDHDRKWYDQLAVRYYAYNPEHNKKLVELRQKIKAAYDEYARRNRTIWAEGLTAEFVGCKTCGSRLSRIHIKSNRCPVCGADLRPESTRKSVEAAKAKWEKAQATEKEYVKKHGKKKVMWLVKIEYHT